VGPEVRKKDTNFRKAVTVEEGILNSSNQFKAVVPKIFVVGQLLTSALNAVLQFITFNLH
jgi:hypothetical protein